jgi:hypothetical protein
MHLYYALIFFYKISLREIIVRTIELDKIELILWRVLKLAEMLNFVGAKPPQN